METFLRNSAKCLQLKQAVAKLQIYHFLKNATVESFASPRYVPYLELGRSSSTVCFIKKLYNKFFSMRQCRFGIVELKPGS